MSEDNLIEDAVKRCAAFDKIDRANGMATPGECTLREHAWTVRSALKAALKTRQWDCAADAYVLLTELYLRIEEAEGAE